MADFHFSNFSKKENQVYEQFRSWRDRLFHPFCTLLKKTPFTPDQISYAGLSMGVLFVLFLPQNLWLALLALILHVFFDGLDGAYARFLNMKNSKGELLDRACDYAIFFVIFAAFMYYHVLNPWWGFVYFVNYTIMVFLTATLNHLRIEFPYILKTKYFVYLFFLIWVVSGFNFFDPLIVFFAVYSIIANLFLFHRLRCSLS